MDKGVECVTPGSSSARLMSVTSPASGRNAQRQIQGYETGRWVVELNKCGTPPNLRNSMVAG